MRLARLLDEAVDRVERTEALDEPAGLLARIVRPLISEGSVEDVLSGAPVGHPIHPMIVALPIGAWSSALALDFTGGDARTTRRLIGLGVVGAGAASITGASDWLTTSGAERRVGLVHAAANYGAVGLHAASWWARRRKGSRVRGVALSLGGMALTVVGGWLGAHLAYALGVGVDTTAFEQLPTDWTDVAGEAEVTERPIGREAHGVPVLLVRYQDRIVALADRCTHRGGALHEGEFADGCITCPLHGSVFAIDGTVRSGPATRPQPAFEVRVENGRVSVRRDEQRALRTSQVGH